MKVQLLLLLVGVLFPLVATAAAKPPAKEVVLGQKANGKTVAVALGQTIVVRLKGNPTTGYQWTVQKIEGKAVKQVGKVEYVHGGDDADGSGGVFVAAFQAVKAGAATVTMGYLRPWEKKKPPIESFIVTLDVKAPEEEEK